MTMRLDLEQLGKIVKEQRTQRKISQQALAQQLPNPVSRTTIALLEQGRRLPPPDVIEQLADWLALPKQIWEPFCDLPKQRHQQFEALLGQLVGHTISLEQLPKASIETAEEVIDMLFQDRMPIHQTYDCMRQLLVYYNLPHMSRAFFDRYFPESAFTGIKDFQSAIEHYQKEAIRLFSTFSEAYRTLNNVPSLEAYLQPLQPKDETPYRQRRSWQDIQHIPEHHLPDLGYISAVRIRQELKEREVLSAYLKQLAQAIRAKGTGAIAEISIRKQRKMDTLLRKFHSQRPHGPIRPLLSPDPAQLETEPERIAPSGQGELERIAMTQRKGLANLSRYLTADFMDVYIATSMRTQADFVSVNRFVRTLFAHDAIAPLHLRYFNPTQSWIEDRVAKGLVEALMLRRADFTFYMAQKSDTFGKDSEASVALGQGKPVIVYVPRFHLPNANIDTDTLARCDEETLKRMIQMHGIGEETEIDDTIDKEGLHAQILTILLHKLNNEDIAEAVRLHWADFDLYAEAERISNHTEREAYNHWLKATIETDNPPAPTPATREHLIRIIVAVAMRFERRARLFREVHPLALQVILSTGVLNGMLVARSVDSCAHLLQGLINNQLAFELRRDEDNYRLVETTTQSTVRVIPRNQLIANAFETFYSKATLPNQSQS
jgi:transcriptional regulator with XRE-family HTH domain